MQTHTPAAEQTREERTGEEMGHRCRFDRTGRSEWAVVVEALITIRTGSAPESILFRRIQNFMLLDLSRSLTDVSVSPANWPVYRFCVRESISASTTFYYAGPQNIIPSWRMNDRERNSRRKREKKAERERERDKRRRVKSNNFISCIQAAWQTRDRRFHKSNLLRLKSI